MGSCGAEMQQLYKQTRDRDGTLISPGSNLAS